MQGFHAAVAQLILLLDPEMRRRAEAFWASLITLPPSNVVVPPRVTEASTKYVFVAAKVKLL